MALRTSRIASFPALSPLRGLAAALLIGLAAPPASAADAEAEAPSTPTLWRVLHPDGRSAFYLLGSIHVGRPGMLTFPKTIDDAYARADELVLEVSLEDLEGADSVSAMGRLATIAPPETLRDRISPETLQALHRYLDRRGDALESYLQFEPWAVAVQVVAREAARAGLDPRHGVDRHFAYRAAGRKPIVGLETAVSQIEILARLPRATQEAFLYDTLVQIRDVGRGTEALVEAWARGDDAALERIVYRGMVEAPELSAYYEQMFFGRNENMTQRLASLSRDGRLRFAVVGAAHLVGERGIPALLLDYGFRVERVALQGDTP